MLPSLNTVADQQSNPTNNTESLITYILEYSATNMSVIIQYKSRDMILHIHSDKSYISEPWARSCTRGHYYLNLLTSDQAKSSNLPSPSNRPIYIEFRILKHVVVSVAEAEV